MAMDLAIVLVAAGSSTRMGFPKLWAEVYGQPLLCHAAAAARAATATERVLVVSTDRLGEARGLFEDFQVVGGGLRRRDSVSAGLAASTAEWLAIHDAARAFAPAALYELGLQAAQASGAAIPVLPVKDTIKRVDGNRVLHTIARAEHVVVQTPQIFRRDLLERALALHDDDVTDEAALIEELGIAVATYPGDERAFKVTTPLDFALARTLLQ